MSHFHSLRVSEVRSLTPNAVAISFEIPEGLRQTFSFTSGQYITIKKELDGKEVRRAYSISSPPSRKEGITIGVKKVAEGTFSKYANEEIKVGDLLEVMPPEGRFIYPAQEAAKTVIAFAAGSGITPIMSIAHAVLQEEDTSFVLVYGNQTREETMFYAEIASLQDKYTDRFFTQYVFSREDVENALFGRIDRSVVNYTLKNKFKSLDFEAVYLCGPEPMIHLISDILKEGEFPENRIYFELFNTDLPATEVSENMEGKTEVEVVLDDEVFKLQMDRKTRVLDAVLDEGIDAPYSCQGGVCSTCIARIKEGAAEMAQNQILTDSEIAEGFVLTCQAHPTTPSLTIDYDDV